MEPAVAASSNTDGGKFDASRVVFEDRNVLDAAKDRIRHLFAVYDNVVVSFSGGKDSLVCLELTREVMDELGMDKLPTKAIFRDEELIPSDVINLVETYYNNPRYDVAWVAYPTPSQKIFMGQAMPYTQWDKDREWVRQPPSFAITSFGIPGDPPVDQHEFDRLAATLYRGSLAIINGIRSYESADRQASTMNAKGPYGYISQRSTSVFCRVIYDWTERDVFRYFYDRNIRYTQLYDKQMHAGVALRVSTPLHAAAFTALQKLPEVDPVFYDQLCSVFDHVPTQVRYYKELDRMAILEKYPKSYAGVINYINDTYEDAETRKQAIATVKRAHKLKRTAKQEGRHNDLCGNGYPLRRLFIQIIKGQYDRGVLPCLSPTQQDEEYEAQAENGGI